MERSRPTTQEEADVRDHVREKSARLFSRAVYQKLRNLVGSWEREERGKTKVVIGALVGLVVLGAFAAAIVLWRPEYGGFSFLLGFLAWIVFAFWLMHRHLGRPGIK